MEFKEFPKMARLSREIVITEKIDGTNACIGIDEEGGFFTGSRSRWITPDDDNFGFSRWAHEHKEELLKLGLGTHFGEWWGKGIQRGYGSPDKRFSLFNTIRWCLYGTEPQQIKKQDPRIVKFQEVLPECCSLVPVLFTGPFDTAHIEISLAVLKRDGSSAAPGFMNPEGVVVYHTAGNFGLKKTLEKDEEPKSKKG